MNRLKRHISIHIQVQADTVSMTKAAKSIVDDSAQRQALTLKIGRSKET